MPDPAPRPFASSWTYPSPSIAPIFVLYGDLSLLNRTSRYGRKILPSPHLGASSWRSSSIGARTRVSYVPLFRCQNALLFSSSSPSKNSSASAFQPRNAIATSSSLGRARAYRTATWDSASGSTHLPSAEPAGRPQPEIETASFPRERRSPASPSASGRSSNANVRVTGTSSAPSADRRSTLRNASGSDWPNTSVPVTPRAAIDSASVPPTMLASRPPSFTSSAVGPNASPSCTATISASTPSGYRSRTTGTMSLE